MSAAASLTAIAQSVVLIATAQNGSIAKTGTGFVIQSTPSAAQIITAAHVVTGGQSSQVFIGGPDGPSYPATIVRVDSLRDIALLSAPAPGLVPLTLASDAVPLSGTDVDVLGYPTMRGTGKPDAQQVMELHDLKLTTAGGKIDGEIEEGESLLFNVPVTHGDSGAPVVDANTGQVTAFVIGEAAGYGSQTWSTGDGFGLSVVGIHGFLDTSLPSPAQTPPAFHVAMHATTSSDIATSWQHLGTSAGFIPDTTSNANPCVDAQGHAAENATISEETESGSAGVYDMTIDVADCSGAIVYHYDLDAGGDSVPDLTRNIGRTFLGFVDTHRAEWASLLKYGVAVDPAKNPYLTLMTVERNPFHQLVVGHVFHGGPADLAGVQAGDAVLKIDGRPTQVLGDHFMAALLNQPEVTMLLSRRDQPFLVKMHLHRFDQVVQAGPVPR